MGMVDDALGGGVRVLVVCGGGVDAVVGVAGALDVLSPTISADSAKSVVRVGAGWRGWYLVPWSE